MSGAGRAAKTLRLWLYMDMVVRLPPLASGKQQAIGRRLHRAGRRHPKITGQWAIMPAVLRTNGAQIDTSARFASAQAAHRGRGGCGGLRALDGMHLVLVITLSSRYSSHMVRVDRQ